MILSFLFLLLWIRNDGIFEDFFPHVSEAKKESVIDQFSSSLKEQFFSVSLQEEYNNEVRKYAHKNEKMGRRAGLSSEDTRAIIVEFIEHFRTPELPAWSSNVWQLMSQKARERGGTWSGHNFYIHVRENRREDLQAAREECGIFIQPKSLNISLNDSCQVDTSMTDNDPNDKTFELEAEAEGLDTFDILITNADWNDIRGFSEHVDKNRSNLAKNIWEHRLSLLIHSQTNLPCAYAFNGVNVYNNPSSLHYLRAKGHCISKICGNPLYFYIDKKPSDSDFFARLRTRSTLFQEHEEVHCPYRGIIREKVGHEVFSEGASNWRRRRVAETTKLGAKVAPTVPNLRTLSQMKKEYVDKQLNVAPDDGKDILLTILNMQNSPEYAQSILDLNSQPFRVIYSSPTQRHAYGRYRKISGKHTTVCIDGSGAGVFRISRPDGTKSGYIFLYTIVIHFDDTIMPIHHMLTESQHTDTLQRFIQVWINPPKNLPKAPKPAQLIVDDSRALLNASCLALNKQTIQAYVETCFMYAIGDPYFQYRTPIETLIRLDVFHLVKMVRNWDCLTSLPLEIARKFWLYCVGLLYDCQTLSSFEEIFSLMCTVGLHECQDDKIMAIPAETVKGARLKLAKLIDVRNDEIFRKDDKENSENACNSEFLCEETTETSRSLLREWIDKIVKKASVKEDSMEQGDPNAFYAPEFIKALIKLAYEFPLWTGVGLPFYVGHGTTSYSEGYFNLWKNNERKNYSRTMRIDKHIKLHLRNSDDQTRIFEAGLSRFVSKGEPLESPVPKKLKTGNEIFTTAKPLNDNHTEKLEKPKKSRETIKLSHELPETSSDDSDSDAIDNWRNKGIERKQKKRRIEIDEGENKFHSKRKDEKLKKSEGVFFNANPEMTYQTNLLKNVKKCYLLENGNSSGIVDIGGDAYLIQNTCHYDVLVQIIMSMAFDNDEYKNFVEKQNNKTLQLINMLMDEGLSAAIYQGRGMILKELFDNRIIPGAETKLRIISYRIDTINNCSDTWMRCFPEISSAFVTCECDNCGINVEVKGIIGVNFKNINANGFQALENDMKEYFVTSRDNFCGKCHQYTCTRTTLPNFQIHIELDVRPDLQPESGKSARLSDFPKSLEINGSTYRLTGLVGYLPLHYVAYCRRANGRWEVYNDLALNVLPCPPETTIVPHVAVYMVETFELSTWSSESVINNINVAAGKEFGVSFEENTNGESFKDFSDIVSASVAASLERTIGDLNCKNLFGDETEISPDYSAEDQVESADAEVLSNNGGEKFETVDNSSASFLTVDEALSSAILSGKKFFVKHASSFDCLLQAFSALASEYERYRDSIKSSSCATLKLVKKYFEHGITEEFCIQRVTLLKTNFPQKVYPLTDVQSEERVIDLQGNICEAWERCMKSSCSGVKRYDCSKCTPYVQPVSFLKAENQRMLRSGFKNLEKILDIHKVLMNVSCVYCKGPSTVTFTYNIQVLVQLLCTNAKHLPKKCKLKDISSTLNLPAPFIMCYRLCSVFAYFQGEYQTFIRRKDDSWAVFPKAFYPATECPETTIIVPHAAVYIISL